MSVEAGGDSVYELRFVVFESASHEEALVFSSELSRGDWFGGVRLHDVSGVIECLYGNVGTPFETFGCWRLLCSAVS